MEMLQFQVCWYRPGARWLVRLRDEILGDYLSKAQALSKAVDAATEAREAGCDAEVWDETAREKVALGQRKLDGLISGTGI